MSGIGMEWWFLYGLLFAIAVVLGKHLGDVLELTVKRLEELIQGTNDIERELKQLSCEISVIKTTVNQLTDHMVPDNDPLERY